MNRPLGGSVSGVASAAGKTPGSNSNGRFSVLLLGADDRPDDPGRSDSIMLISADLDKAQVKLLSLERDIWTRIPGHGYDKLNHAYAFGRENLSAATAENLIGMPLDHYVVVNMDGFKEIIRILDGIDIDVEKNMDYDDPQDSPPLHIHLRKGFQHLDPVKALGYVRFRHDAESDVGRMRRQQQMIKAVAKEMLRPSTLLKLPQLIPACFNAVRTDLTLSQVLKLANIARKFSPDNVKSQGSISGEEFVHNEVDYEKADVVELRTMIYHFFTDTEPSEEFLAQAKRDQQTYLASIPVDRPSKPATPGKDTKPTPGNSSGSKGGTKPVEQSAQPTVVLQDASGKNLAAKAVGLLTGANFRVVQTMSSKNVNSTTIIGLHTNSAGIKERLQSLFPKAHVVSMEPVGPGEAPVEMILGSDLTL